MKRFVGIVVGLVVLASFFFAGSPVSAQDDDAVAATAAAEANFVKIGILQFAPHASLDNCYEGIIEGLKKPTIWSSPPPAPRLAP